MIWEASSTRIGLSGQPCLLKDGMRGHRYGEGISFAKISPWWGCGIRTHGCTRSALTVHPGIGTSSGSVRSGAAPKAKKHVRRWNSVGLREIAACPFTYMLIEVRLVRSLLFLRLQALIQVLASSTSFSSQLPSHLLFSLWSDGSPVSTLSSPPLHPIYFVFLWYNSIWQVLLHFHYHHHYRHLLLNLVRRRWRWPHYPQILT